MHTKRIVRHELPIGPLCDTSRRRENNDEEVIVKTIKAKGNKCPICWKISEDACERH